MFNKTLKAGKLLTIILCVCLLSACSIVINAENNENIYNRENTNLFCSNFDFGYGFDDVEYTALDYIYKSEELKEKYGETFEVKEMGGNSESLTIKLFWLYTGKGKYFVNINDDNWTVELSKEYFGKWKVTMCYPGWEVN